MKTGNATTQATQVILPFDLNTVTDKLQEFVTGTFKKSAPVADLKSLKNGNLIIFKDGKSVHLVIFDELKEDGKSVSYKTELMSSETHITKPKDLKNFFVITESFAGEIAGENKKEVLALLALVLRDVDQSVRVGGFFMSKEEDKSKTGIALKKKIEEYFKKEFNLEVTPRWSDKCAKEMKSVEGEGAGYNLSVKNPHKNKWNTLFDKGAYHHKHHTLIEIRPNEKMDDIVIKEGSQQLMEWLKEMNPTTTKKEKISNK